MLMIQSQRCPIDLTVTTQEVSIDELTMHVWEQCPLHHMWPLKHDGADLWSPDPEATRVQMEEYGVAET